MTIEYIRYKIPSETREAFFNSYIKAGESLRASDYCLGYELTHGEEEPENFILRIEWTSLEDHINKFRKSDAFKAFYQDVAPYFGNIQEMKHYDLTEVYWKK
jgi:quinol monooxygenase YgiN